MKNHSIAEKESSKWIGAEIRKFRFLLIVFLLLLLGSSFSFLQAQVVSPMQGGHYSPGVKNIRDMAAPPSGLFVLWYNAYFNSDTYVDRNGNVFNTIRLDQINDKLPNINVDLNLKGFTSIPAIFWASEFKVLGGAKYMVGISPNYVSADASILTERDGIFLDTTFVRSAGSKNSGLSDLFIAPLGLSWGFEKVDFTFLYGFYAPTGKYETGSSDVVGLGFWTHQLQGYGYYYPVQDKSTAFFAGLTYEMNGKIKDVDVKPGNRFSLEWGISQYLSKKLEVGAMLAHNWQISEDSGDNVYWDRSFYDRKNMFAFNAGYWIWDSRLMANVKYVNDFGARQRFENNTWLLNLVFVTNALKGK